MRMACGMRRATCERVAVHFIGHENAFRSAIAATPSSHAHAARRTHRVPDTIGVPHIHVGRLPHISRDNGEVLI